VEGRRNVPLGVSADGESGHRWRIADEAAGVFEGSAKTPSRLAHIRIWGIAPMGAPDGSWDRRSGTPVRCLIVDDNAGFRDEMRALLEEQGLSVIGDAASGAEAIRQIVEARPDVVLIDIDLGEESGIALTRSLRDAVDPAALPRVILISTHDEREYADLIEASPAVGFLAKTDLSAPTIRQMLAGR
jgi:CheY-like chemotaxis protein